ncbi:sensor histidine kinase [Streptomyces sp. P1-3]|uniref:sensor histidine kinase n=1 Tax=Streptomyces sp. P1-3 TaxID=3421658 RepID=UPI003D35F161
MGAVTPLAVARPYRWLSAHPRAMDSALALVVFAVTLIGSANAAKYTSAPPLSPVFVLASALASGSLVLRGRFPRGVLAFTSALTLAELVITGSHSLPRSAIAVSVVVALYTVASRTDRPTTWRIGAATVVVITSTGMIFGAGSWYGQENVGVLAWTALAAAVGDAVRSRRAFVAAIEERAERAERSREEEARRRVAEERLRIARDLHDVVAHHIALVNVQAGVASHVMDSRPDQAKEALAHVREASRSALDELRATVGLLRQYGDPAAPTEPAPGLGVLDQLVDGFVRAGLRVEVVMEPADGPGPLAATVDLTAYRVVQEALTNVHKHAGPQAKAEVRIVRGPGWLEITVLDDGAGAAADADGDPEGEPDGASDGGEQAGGGGGHGLIGMSERIAALRGQCEAGPLPEGGFRVRARLPLQVRTGGDDR